LFFALVTTINIPKRFPAKSLTIGAREALALAA
jgi:hypothetical protein